MDTDSVQQQLQREMANQAQAVHPENQPELQRELQILGGALSCLFQRIDEHIAQLQPVLKNYPEAPVEERAKLTSTRPEVLTQLGEQLVGMSNEVGMYEEKVIRATHRLGI